MFLFTPIDGMYGGCSEDKREVAVIGVRTQFENAKLESKQTNL